MAVSASILNISEHMANHKAQLLQRSLESFFRGKGLFASVIVPITTQRSDVSLRTLDFFVTSYAKQHDLTYTHQQRAVSVYRDYRSQLRAYTKRYFDPFCRRERITVSDGHTTIVTTVGQLNFFRFAVENDLVAACRRHRHALDQAMAAAEPPPRKPAPNLATCASHTGSLRLTF